MIEDFINDYYKSFRNDNFAVVATSLFPMLGILGTFTAIAISMPDFSIDDMGSLDKQISIPSEWNRNSILRINIWNIPIHSLDIFWEEGFYLRFDGDKLHLESLYKEYIWSDSELKKHEPYAGIIYEDDEACDSTKGDF